jgi:hypothetical protein
MVKNLLKEISNEEEFHLEATTTMSVMATDLVSAKEWFAQELATNNHIEFDIEES